MSIKRREYAEGTDYVKEASKQAVTRVVQAKLNIAYLHLSQTGLDPYGRPTDEQRKQAWQTLIGFAYQDLRAAELELFTWHRIRPDDPALAEATKDVLRDFWEKPMAIMHFLNLTRQQPGAYFTADEEDFRRQLKEAIERI